MKHIHFIGICGVGMGALAIMMKKKGWKVTGSDVGFYPPISTHLKDNEIEYYAGWHVEKMGMPDLVVVGNVAGSENPEFLFVQKNNIPFVSYPELIERELIKTNSIVCAGTYGKTSTTALLSWILINADYKPAYMFGGLTQTPKLASDDLGGTWNVLEGDEYKTSRFDNGAKFFHYHPTHLLLTATKWDHADIYPTEEEYINAFKKLVDLVPNNGLIVVNENVPVEITNSTKCKLINYGSEKKCDFKYSNILQTENELSFTILNRSINYEIKANIIGDFQADNITACFALACEIGIEPNKIISAISSFKGIKRRLEKRGQTSNGTKIIDDIAHSPIKAKNTLQTLKKIYSGKIICVFEPNTGNRTKESIPSYKNAFNDAELVIIPKLTKLKNDSEYLNGVKLAEIIKKDNPNTIYLEDDAELVNYLLTTTDKNDVVAFCGSHGFRGMIDELTK